MSGNQGDWNVGIGPENEGGVDTLERPKTDKPSMYKVIMYNDDYTPMEFVTEVLETVFNKSKQEAILTMLTVHRAGMGICGVYTLDVAETKAQKSMDMARKEGHPLQLTVEKD
jgi:ATP-dependent Clp protease adaptor protein ClpS